MHGAFKEHHWKPLPMCVEVKSVEGKGYGLFATENIPGGSHLGISHMQCDERQEKIFGGPVMRMPVGAFINHSNTPNCAFLCHPEPGDHNYLGLATHLWTIVPIKKGTELTAFYTDGYEDIIDNYGVPKNLANKQR